MGNQPVNILRRHHARGLATGRALTARPGLRMASGTHTAIQSPMPLPANVGLFAAFITIAQMSGTTASKGPGGSSPVEASCIDQLEEEPTMPAQCNACGISCAVCTVERVLARRHRSRLSNCFCGLTVA